jgi:hypothetical protein
VNFDFLNVIYALEIHNVYPDKSRTDMTITRKRIFISSVQKEFAQVRRDLKAFLLGDAVLRRFVSDVFLFEELPARDQQWLGQPLT